MAAGFGGDRNKMPSNESPGIGNPAAASTTSSSALAIIFVRLFADPAEEMNSSARCASRTCAGR